MRKILCLSFALSCIGFITHAQTAKLIGEWQLKRVVVDDKTYENIDAVYIFEKGGILKAARSVDAEVIQAGKWKYKEQQHTIIMNSELDKDFNGTATLVELSETELIYEKDKAILYFRKLKRSNVISKTESNIVKSDIIRLTFKEADFFDNNGEYKYYDDEVKLPWQDIDEKPMSLVNVQQLVYKYSALDEDETTFTEKVLRANVNSNPAELSLSIDFIFYGFDRNSLPEDSELPVNTDYSNLLYPEEDNSFRVVGSEKITTSAGTFDCTVVEAVGSFETCKKLWMIDDKPGVYAKIISDKPGPFGQYSIYELQEIKMKE